MNHWSRKDLRPAKRKPASRIGNQLQCFAPPPSAKSASWLRGVVFAGCGPRFGVVGALLAAGLSLVNLGDVRSAIREPVSTIEAGRRQSRLGSGRFVVIGVVHESSCRIENVSGSFPTLVNTRLRVQPVLTSQGPSIPAWMAMCLQGCFYAAE